MERSKETDERIELSQALWDAGAHFARAFEPDMRETWIDGWTAYPTS